MTPGDPHILLVHSPVHVWDILVDQLAYAKFHLLSIFFRNILHGYSHEQTLTTCMYTLYLALWCGPPLFLDLQSNLTITQRYLSGTKQSVSYGTKERVAIQQNIYLLNFCHMMNIQTHTWKGHHMGSQRATERKRGLP